MSWCEAEHHVVTYIPCLEQEDKGGHFVGHGRLGVDCTLVRFGIAACYVSSAKSLYMLFICPKNTHAYCMQKIVLIQIVDHELIAHST